MTVVDTELRASIAQRAQAALNRYQPSKYRLDVDPAAILQDGEWYHVVVKSPNDVRDREFYDALAKAESDLNDRNDGHQYLLVPAITD